MSEIKTNKISPRKGTTQTIGDSGDTLSIACGATLSNAGTISTAGITGGTIDNQGTITGLQGVINWDTTAKTTNFNASSQTGYFVNTTSGAITVTFPASPTAGDVIALKDYANTFDTNNLTIDANGNNIQGSASNFDITVEGTAAQFIYVDATRGWVLTDASKASDIIGPEFVAATGGTITTSGDYKIHTFTGPGTFTVSNAGNPFGSSTVDYLIVAGGGGGGSKVGGGGGAGGYRESSGAASGCYSTSPRGSGVSALPVSVTAYPITVGGGGSGGAQDGANNGSNGTNSIFSSITSSGGGYAAHGCGNNLNGNSGGSGGGGGGKGLCNLGGSGNTPSVAPIQGTSGAPGSNCGPALGGGGGGGAIISGSFNMGGGQGGCGGQTSISTSAVYYAGGGGGGVYEYNFASPTCGAGGLGGGGPGQCFAAGTPGTTNRGGGGGGGAYRSGIQYGGGSGGSGIVIIRYKYQ